jgi:manganese/zinc/iron transport system substrate-binding protein
MNPMNYQLSRRNLNHRLLSYVTMLVVASLVAGCGGLAADIGDLSSRPIRVVATTGMVTDIVQIVGGERVQVKGLMGPGIDPHTYKATEGNVIDLAGADLVFYSGLHLEAKLVDVFEKMGGRITTAAVTDAIDRSRLVAPPQFQGNYDPHVWFDVTMWMSAVEEVERTLSTMDPTHASGYHERAQAYLAQLRELDAYVHAQAARVPESQRVLVTAHDAFNYFGRAYGFEVRGLQGISTATEAGAADVKALADFIVERRIPAIFVESSVPLRNVEALQAAVRARGFDVRIGGQLYSDAMGDPGTEDGTYIGMVRHNIDTIVGALLGQ